MPEPKKVGFVGLGAMGMGMATQLLDVARELKFPLPMAALAHQLFLAAASTGLGNQDDSSVVKLFENVSGTSVARNR